MYLVNVYFHMQQVPVRRTRSSFSAVVGDKHDDLGHALGELSQLRQEASARFDCSEEREQLEEESLADAKNEKEVTPEVQAELAVQEVEKHAEG